LFSLRQQQVAARPIDCVYPGKTNTTDGRLPWVKGGRQARRRGVAECGEALGQFGTRRAAASRCS
jgi:hypothetical protein